MKKYDDRDLSPSKREKILQKYDYVCVYCFGNAEQVDHIIPWAYIHNDSEDNLVACCWLCNIVAGSNVFEDFNKKREFIQKRRYNWIKKNPIPLWLRDEVDELSYALKEKIKLTCIILDTNEERQKVKRILMDEGYRVLIGEKRKAKKAKELKMVEESNLTRKEKEKWKKLRSL